MNLAKFLIISDLHGRDCWQHSIKNNIYDKVIFLGDYVDSFDLPDKVILDNLNNIINFKINNMDNVILLWGNHEHQYRIPINSYNYYKCSGYRDTMHVDLYDILTTHKNLFLNAYQYKNNIFTHAGVHQGWFTYNFKGDITANIADQLNNPISKEQQLTLHDISHYRGGCNNVGGIFWCDKKELNKPLMGFDQIVGHTHVKNIMKQTNKYGNVWFTDCKNKEDLLLYL